MKLVSHFYIVAGGCCKIQNIIYLQQPLQFKIAMGIQMKKHKIAYRNLFLFLSFLLLILLPYSISQAASATLTLSTDTKTAAVGDDIMITLSISSDTMLGDFEAFITYNADILEFKSDASFIAGGEGLLKLTDKNTVNKENSRKYIMKFKAKAIGISEIAIKDKAEIYELESGLAMSVSSNRLDIRVSASETASDNTNLKSLKISPGTLTPAFDKNITEYTADLKYEDEKLVISAVTEDENSKVTVEGNEKLTVGNNKIIVKVKAESGNTKEYRITATRKESDKQETAEINESDETDTDKDANTQEYNDIKNTAAEIGKLLIIKDGDERYIQNGFRYRILEPGDDVAIPQGYIKTSLILNNVTVTAYTPENDLDNDFLLLYAMNEDGETGFYQYDRAESTLQRYAKGKDGNKVVMSADLMRSEDYKAKLTAMGIVLAVLGAACIILSVVLIRVYLKKKD